jgi:hypothetical protein
MNVHQPSPGVVYEEVDPYEMANLYPRETGLPMTIWAGPRGGARHDVRVKVCRSHGNRMDVDGLASVSVRPTAELMAGDLSNADLKAVQAWITLNRDALIGYWDGELGTVEFVQALKKL